MNNFQTGRARDGGSPNGRIVVGLGVLALFVGAFLVAFVLGSQPGSPQSAAGLASPSAAALESGPGGSPSAGASTLPSASASAKPSPKSTPKPTPRPTPRPTATPNTRPAISSFQIPTTADCGGSTGAVQIQITWVVKRATGVTISIDGPGIYDSYHGTTGLATVPFACGVGDTKHTYTLTTTGGSGPAAHQTKTVKRTN